MLRFHTSESSAAERGLHRALQTRGDHKSTCIWYGQEWFLTDLVTLDKIARTLGLEAVYRSARKPASLFTTKSSAKVAAPRSTD